MCRYFSVFVCVNVYEKFVNRSMWCFSVWMLIWKLLCGCVCGIFSVTIHDNFMYEYVWHVYVNICVVFCLCMCYYWF